VQIKIPNTARRKALFIIDVQPPTLTEGAKKLIPSMVKMIDRTEYDAYVEAIFFADEQSMFFKQNGFLRHRDEAGKTAEEIRTTLVRKTKPHILVEKNTRSCFKALNAPELTSFLKHHKIEEAHFIGFDINDCVLASAYDAIDLGYFAYVIEELCHHWEANELLKESAIAIYRRQNMSNNGHDFPVTTIGI
jgi:nicotinamidase-related amidase